MTRHRRVDWRPTFLRVLADSGNVSCAARAAGVDRTTVYARTRRDPMFAAAWEQAEQEAIDALEVEARRRALAGSDSLLRFLLRSLRPERYSERLDVRLDFRRKAQQVAERLGISVDEVVDRVERTLEQE